MGQDAYDEFRDIDYDNGTVNFVSGQSSTITSNYSVKDFSTYLSSETEEKLLFETKIQAFFRM